MVNTFLPVADFEISAQILDYRRLGKQRVEVIQLLKANFGLTKGWVNHPAAKMWRGHEVALGSYGKAMCKEWIDRGFKDSCTAKIQALLDEHTNNTFVIPHWYGNDYFHRSHRSNLLRKNTEFYSQYNWDVPDNLDYLWPEPGPIRVVNGNLDKVLRVQDLDEHTLEVLRDESFV